MIIFRKITVQNFLSIGNTPIEIELDKHTTTLIVGKNGSGKCVEYSTMIDIRNKTTGEIKTISIGELYAQTKSQQGRED